MTTMHGVRLITAHDKVFADTRRNGWPSFEPESMAAWLAVARPGVVMLDVGAYTGLYAISAALRGADVHAFEPSLDAHARLCRNVYANAVPHRVTAHRKAAGRSPGRAALHAPAVRLTSASRAVPDPDGGVEVVTLDSLAPAAPVAALKVDVEGSEPDVLEGAVGILIRYHPLVIAEAHTDRDRAAIDAVLSPMGYVSRRADGRNVICEAT